MFENPILEYRKWCRPENENTLKLLGLLLRENISDLLPRRATESYFLFPIVSSQLHIHSHVQTVFWTVFWSNPYDRNRWKTEILSGNFYRIYESRVHNCYLNMLELIKQIRNLFALGWTLAGLRSVEINIYTATCSQNGRAKRYISNILWLCLGRSILEEVRPHHTTFVRLRMSDFKCIFSSFQFWCQGRGYSLWDQQVCVRHIGYSFPLK